AIEVMLDNRAAAVPSRFDLGRTCERLKTLTAPRALRQQVEVVLDVQKGPMEVRGYEDQVQAALLNVIVNALEAMPDRGRLAIRVEGDGSRVCVSVCDSGPGLPLRPDDPQWRPHFVDDLRQTGMGLHVTRTIVESHEGQIACRSNIPRGTCIEITFPAATA